MSEVMNRTRSVIVYQILEMEILSVMIWCKKGQIERCDEQAFLRGQGLSHSSPPTVGEVLFIERKAPDWCHHIFPSMDQEYWRHSS